MLAYTYKKHGLFQLEEKEKPVLLAPSDAIVRVTLASICTSDLHIKHGSVPALYRELLLVTKWWESWKKPELMLQK